MVIGRVYKICTDEKYTDEIYIGSTFDSLENRFRRHKTHYCSSSILFDKYGYENCHIELVKEYDVIDREHLEAYETLWICKYRNKCVNKSVPFCIKKIYLKVYRKDNRYTISKQRKVYYETNKDDILKQKKIYYDANKDTILEQRKAFRKDNIDTILKYQKSYRITNRDTLLEKKKAPWTCESCNITMRISSKTRHLKSKKHQDNLSQK